MRSRIGNVNTLESARQRAEETILDERLFFVDARAHDKFLMVLDNPAQPTKELRALLKRRPSWES